MKHTFLLSLLLLVYFLSSAQIGYRKGNLVTLKNDTIHGEIYFNNDVQNSKVCMFKTKSDTIKYYPFSIKSFRFLDGKKYVSKIAKTKDGHQPIFAEYIYEGKKNIYYHRDSKGFHYSITKTKDTILEIPYYEKYFHDNGTRKIYQSTKHVSLLKLYFKDCPELYSDIDKIKQPNGKNLLNIAKKYHQITCNEEVCTKYIKSKNPLTIIIEPIYGSYKGNGSIMGSYLKFWLPKANENIYFKTGLLYATYKSTHHSFDGKQYKENENYYIIPLSMDYYFPSKKIQPKLTFGLNLWTKNNACAMLFSLGVGVDIKLFKNTKLTFEYTPMNITNNIDAIKTKQITMGLAFNLWNR